MFKERSSIKQKLIKKREILCLLFENARVNNLKNAETLTRWLLRQRPNDFFCKGMRGRRDSTCISVKPASTSFLKTPITLTGSWPSSRLTQLGIINQTLQPVRPCDIISINIWWLTCIDWTSNSFTSKWVSLNNTNNKRVINKKKLFSKGLHIEWSW